jgi:hypothetical protein
VRIRYVQDVDAQVWKLRREEVNTGSRCVSETGVSVSHRDPILAAGC